MSHMSAPHETCLNSGVCSNDVSDDDSPDLVRLVTTHPSTPELPVFKRGVKAGRNQAAQGCRSSNLRELPELSASISRFLKPQVEASKYNLFNKVPWELRAMSEPPHNR